MFVSIKVTCTQKFKRNKICLSFRICLWIIIITTTIILLLIIIIFYNNNPKCCRNTKTISLTTQVFKSLNEVPHFQTAPEDPTVHLICLHVLPLSFSLLFSRWVGISWTSVLGKHSGSTSTALGPWRTRRDVGIEDGGREGEMVGEQRTREWKG